MPDRHFPNWIKAFTEFTSKSEAPREFHFWSGVSTIAGTLRRRVWIDQRQFEWVPNFFIVLVGPAGVVNKSTSMKAGLSLLHQVEGFVPGPNSITWQGLAKHLESATVGVPYETEEGSTYLTMSCVTCAISELGTFLRPEDQRMVDVLTDLWDGQKDIWKHELATQDGHSIVNPWVNIIGCTTPTWIRENVPEKMIGGGLMSRILFIYGDQKHQLVPYPSAVQPNDYYRDFERKLVDDLNSIAEMIGEFQLTPEAVAYGSAWYEDHWRHRPEHLASERFSGYLARKQTHLHKLAMILSTAESNSLVIEERHLEMGLRILRGLENDMMRVFEMVGMGTESRHTMELIAILRLYKSMPQDELWRSCMRYMSQRDFTEALSGARAAGLITLGAEDGKLQIVITPRGLGEKGKDK